MSNRCPIYVRGHGWILAHMRAQLRLKPDRRVQGRGARSGSSEAVLALPVYDPPHIPIDQPPIFSFPAKSEKMW